MHKIGLCLAADRDQATAGGVACDTDSNSDSDSEQDQRFAISANAPFNGEILEYKIHPCNWIRMANKERFESLRDATDILRVRLAIYAGNPTRLGY